MNWIDIVITSIMLLLLSLSIIQIYTSDEHIVDMTELNARQSEVCACVLSTVSV